MMGSSSKKSNKDEHQENKDTNFILTEAFIAPWGLANEERPFHFLWSGDIQGLELYFTNPVELLEGYNIKNSIEDHSSVERIEDGHNLTKVSLMKDDFVTEGYFSGKFTIPEKFEDSIVAQKITAKFELPDDDERQWEDYTFTIRPKIQVGEEPGTHVIPANGDPDPIEVDMQYIGFGLAQVNTKAGWEGELISKGDSIYHDMAEALVKSGLYEKETDEIPDVPEEWKEGTEIEIPQNEIEQFVTEFREQIEGGNMEEMFEPDILDQLIAFLESDDEERDISPVYQQIELMLLGSVLDLIDRHPSENVEMSNPQTTVEIESQMRGIMIKYELRDNLGNNYGAIEIPVDIEDLRPNNNDLVEIDVNTNWEEVQLDTDELRRLKEDIAEL